MFNLLMPKALDCCRDLLHRTVAQNCCTELWYSIYWTAEMTLFAYLIYKSNLLLLKGLECCTVTGQVLTSEV